MQRILCAGLMILMSFACVSPTTPKEDELPMEPPRFSPPTPAGLIVIRYGGLDTTWVYDTLFHSDIASAMPTPVKMTHRNGFITKFPYGFVSYDRGIYVMAVGITTPKNRYNYTPEDTLEFIFTKDTTLRVRVPILVVKDGAQNAPDVFHRRQRKSPDLRKTAFDSACVTAEISCMRIPLEYVGK